MDQKHSFPTEYYMERFFLSQPSDPSQTWVLWHITEIPADRSERLKKSPYASLYTEAADGTLLAIRAYPYFVIDDAREYVSEFLDDTPNFGRITRHKLYRLNPGKILEGVM